MRMKRGVEKRVSTYKGDAVSFAEAQRCSQQIGMKTFEQYLDEPFDPPLQIEH